MDLKTAQKISLHKRKASSHHSLFTSSTHDPKDTFDQISDKIDLLLIEGRGAFLKRDRIVGKEKSNKLTKILVRKLAKGKKNQKADIKPEKATKRIKKTKKKERSSSDDKSQHKSHSKKDSHGGRKFERSTLKSSQRDAEIRKFDQKHFISLVHDGLLFRKAFLGEGEFNDNTLNLEYSLEQYCFLFKFLLLNQPKGKQFKGEIGDKQISFKKKMTWFDFCEKINKIRESLTFFNQQKDPEQIKKFSPILLKNLISFQKKFKNFKHRLFYISNEKCQKQLQDISEPAFENIEEYIKNFQKTKHNFEDDFLFINKNLDFIQKAIVNCVDEMLRNRELHTEAFLKALLENLQNKAILKKINWARVKKLKTTYCELLENKHGRSNFTNETFIMNKNVCTANIYLTFKKIETSVAIPVYLPNLDIFNFFNVDGPRSEFINQTMWALRDLVEHYLRENVILNDLNELHSEKNVVAAIYQFNRYLGKVLAKAILDEGIDIQKNMIKEIVIQIYSTRNTCPTCELFLSAKFHEVFIALMESILEPLNLLDLMNKIDEKDTLLRKKLIFTIPDKQDNEPSAQDNKNEGEKLLVKDNDVKHYFNWEFLEKLITDSPNFMQFKRTYFLSAAQDRNANSFERTTRIEETVGEKLNLSREIFGATSVKLKFFLFLILLFFPGTTIGKSSIAEYRKCSGKCYG